MIQPGSKKPRTRSNRGRKRPAGAESVPVDIDDGHASSLVPETASETAAAAPPTIAQHGPSTGTHLQQQQEAATAFFTRMGEVLCTGMASGFVTPVMFGNIMSTMTMPSTAAGSAFPSVSFFQGPSGSASSMVVAGDPAVAQQQQQSSSQHQQQPPACSASPAAHRARRPAARSAEKQKNKAKKK